MAIQNEAKRAKKSVKEFQQSLSNNAEQVSANVKDTAQTVSDSASNLATSVTDSVAEKAQQRTEHLSSLALDELERLSRALSRAINASGQQFDEEGFGFLAGAARKTAAQVDAAAGQVKSRDPAALSNQIGDFIREKPVAAVSIAALAGFAVASLATKRSS